MLRPIDEYSRMKERDIKPMTREVKSPAAKPMINVISAEGALSFGRAELTTGAGLVSTWKDPTA